jgi:hypothetical protein
VESKDSDVLTDSFHSDGLQSESSGQENSAILYGLNLSKKPSTASLISNISTDTLDSNRSRSSSYENFRIPYSESSDTGSINSQTDYQIRVELASPEDTRTLEQKQLAEQSVKYYMSTEVKLRGRGNSGEHEPVLQPQQQSLKRPPLVPVRAPPEASPIWKRKNNIPVINGGPVKVPELKRMSNISETSEPDSIDGQYSSSPSSENISVENVSIGSENSIGYQRRLRLSVTPDHQNPAPKSADKHRKRVYRIGLNMFNK